MRHYEFVFILDPGLKEKEQKERIAKIEQFTLGLKGKVKKKELWGEKDLSYPIKKFNQGFYVKLDLGLPEDKIKEWETKIKLDAKIIRYLLIKLE
jgi:small subunit ribosomal protein S6